MTLPFPTLQVMLAIMLVGETLLMRRRLSADTSRQADRGSLRLLLVVIAGSVGAGWLAGRACPQARFEPLFHLGPTAMASLYAAGIALFVSGLALRWYAVGYLGRWFTYDVAIAADHRVVDTGPYRLIRHPAYTGSLMAFLGLGLCGGNLVGLAVLVTPIALAFLRRIAVEEGALAAALGPAYTAYMGRTRRLVPFVY